MKAPKKTWPALATGVTALMALTGWLDSWGWGPGVHRVEAQGSPGAVYTMTNDTTDNRVIAYRRGVNGLLTPIGMFSTNGLGTGANLYSQGSVSLSPDHRFLFAVDAGSNEVSSFAVQANGSLTFVSKAPTSGLLPTSVTAYGNFLYVMNASGNISGFTIASDGSLTPIPNSTRHLSSMMARPGQVSFSNDGTLLVVTEKYTNKIDTFTVAPDGLATGPLVQNSHGAEPFGFAFDNAGHLIVSEGVPSADSSYSVSSMGVLTVISGSVTDNEKQDCWVVNTNNPSFPTQYSYAANTGSGNISSYTIGSTGTLTLLAAVAGSSAADARDMALSADSNYLYVFERAVGTIGGFSVQSNGSLMHITKATGIPTTAYGLAGY